MIAAAPSMTIARLATAAGVGVETVRYYQRRGLIAQPPRGSGPGSPVRRYDAETLRRLRFIRSAQGAGFTLTEIAELLELDATGDRTRARALAEARIAALDARIAELQIARNALSGLARDCASKGAGACPILAAFEPG